MERNSAAHAMEWSIDLEKALRSNSPALSTQAILQFGPRLLRWSHETSPPKLAAHHMFDLITGEDRLFSNAILLRLADAFNSGDQHIKLCVVKVFLMEYKQREKCHGRRYKGFLSKGRVWNRSELLSRVKVVFDNGDCDSKALALALFGCWADFAKDSSHIRYLVLSSLVSSQLLEVKAALFAAGCFCELSDDFPCIVLEILVNMMSSTETLLPVRLAAARVYAKLRYSYSTAIRAYKTGLKLVLDSPEENYQIAMLLSLSKIASTFSVLISDQVGFLLLFLSPDKTLKLQATALKCLCFLFNKGAYNFLANVNLAEALFSTLGESLVPANIQCIALRILRKMVLYMHSLPSDILDLDKLLTVAENASMSPFMSKSLLAVCILVEMSNKFKGRRDIGSNWSCPSITSGAISIIFNWITLEVKPLFDTCPDSTVFQEVNKLFNLLLSIIDAHLDSVGVLIDQIFVFLKYLSEMNNNTVIRLKLVYKVYRFMVTCLEFQSKEAGVVDVLVYDKVKLLVDNVCECKDFDCYTHTIYSLLLHSPAIWGHNMNKSEESCNLDDRSGIVQHSYSVEHESVTIEFAKKILAENRNWLAYKVGMYSSCQGSWLTSSFIFQQLITLVHSDSCSLWLKSLVEFAKSEEKVMLLVLKNEGYFLADRSKKIRPYIPHFYTVLAEADFGEVLFSAYDSLCSSKKTLEGDVTCQAFLFQRWFLSLRAKTLRGVADVLKILGAISEESSKSGSLADCLFSLEQIAQVSLRLEKLVKEFDLFSTSFVDMDNESLKIISGLALSTSLLSFITGSSLFIPNLHDPCSKNSTNNLHAHLIDSLAGKLLHMDNEVSAKLYQIMNTDDHNNVDCCNSNLKFRNQAWNVGYEARDVLDICRVAVFDIACLQSEASGTLNEEDTYRITKNVLQFIFKILIKWRKIPFRTPKYFFRLRPCIGSELFAVNVAKNADGIFVSQGDSLSLSLCLQLRNVPTDLPVRPKKLYTMLYSRVSFQQPKPISETKENSSRSSYQVWETADMVEMNEKLLHYVTQHETKNTINSNTNVECGFVKTYVCFEADERGQGFSSCLLDISRFPTGSYRVEWVSCFVDNHGAYWSLLPLNAGPEFTIF
uniref:Integrator complex subunit 7 n=1 Tax=Cannabis sativa TaxID=3483 RepID=A0A803NG78_CANSA